MPVIQGLGWTFDTVAPTYEKFRPGYVPELYRMIFDYIPIGPDSHVVEVGSGGGQATAPMLTTGCRLTAVECGEKFSHLLREKFKEYKDFSVVTAKFEDADFAPESCDLVFAATSFHWVPEAVGYPKVYEMLRSGGAFARFRNHAYKDKGNLALAEEIDALYDQYYDGFYGKKSPPLAEFTEEQARDRAMIAEKHGFTDIRYALFHRQRTFTADEYIELLGTYSDHIAIEESIRKTFFAKIREAILRHGGTITIYDTIDLQLARKR